MSRPMLRNNGPGFGVRTVWNDGELHWDLGAVTYVGLGVFQRDFKTFNNYIPGSTGNVQMFVGGDDKSGGTLSNFVSDTSATYVTERLLPTQLEGWLRTTTVYKDAGYVSMHYQVRDEVGRPQVSTTGVEVQLWVNFGTSLAVFACALPDASTGGNDCLGDFTPSSVYADWFNDQNPSTLVSYVRLYVNSVLVAQSTFNILTLVEVNEYTELTAVGAWLETGIYGPKYNGNVISTTMYAHTGGQVLTSYKVTITYNDTALDFGSLSTSSLYNGATCNLDGCTGFTGTISALVNGISSGTTQAAVTGSSVELMSLTWTVTGPAGVYPNAISFVADAFVNVGTRIYSENMVGQVNGPADFIQTSATITILDPKVRFPRTLPCEFRCERDSLGISAGGVG